ncbi:unnamed protein product [Hermetia illucens]|uniref:Uncharacterized protein n=1 Tax=Hermetia illucens TaxID=343691 RepID=A0A7R8UWA3_HERIL|nr:larval/pupal cuticle protein H1C-like [Hermetia illucens]CAD7088285.1 unnamed protein product [Hermetia illucens]
MTSKFVALCTLFVAVNAGLLPAAVTTYSAAPGLPLAHAAPLVRYSPAAEVSHSYSSIAAPAALAYAAPIAKAVSYGPAAVAVSAPAVGATQESVYRSLGGTVSQYSKAVDTAFSSVRKYDTRINNNVFAPAIAKTVAYAAPAPALVAHAAPAVVAHAAPAVVAHSAPAIVSAAAPAVYSAHAPTLYSAHATPAVTAYATKALSYSPATAVAHVSYNGYGANYAW